MDVKTKRISFVVPCALSNNLDTYKYIFNGIWEFVLFYKQMYLATRFAIQLCLAAKVGQCGVSLQPLTRGQ
jgi:hypothetical protein